MSCFRLGTLTILVTHINWWIILHLLVSSMVVTVLAHHCQFPQLAAISAGPINFFIMGSGINLDQDCRKCWKNKKPKKETQMMFYRRSTLFIFCWNTFWLAGLLAGWTFVADCETSEDIINMNTFYQAEWRQKVFMREGIRGYGLYAVVGGIIFTGFLNLIFVLVNPDVELADSLKSKDNSSS